MVISDHFWMNQTQWWSLGRHYWPLILDNYGTSMICEVKMSFFSIISKIGRNRGLKVWNDVKNNQITVNVLV